MKKVIKNTKLKLSGEITIPSDKSISHRAIIFSSLAKGKSIIKNFSKGQDPLSSLAICKELGVDAEFINNDLIVISSGKFNPPQKNLDCGNSGTTMRFLCGILAGQNFNSVLIGDESLSKRPMKRVIEPLTLMGAKIEGEKFKAPLKIYGQNLHAIDYNSPLSSAQVKSCVLLAGMMCDGQTTFTEPYLSRNHTELMLKYMGAEIELEGKRIRGLEGKLFNKSDIGKILHKQQAKNLAYPPLEGGSKSLISEWGNTNIQIAQQVRDDGQSQTDNDLFAYSPIRLFSSVKISKSTLRPQTILIPGDISSAAFFIVAGLIVPNSQIILKNVGLNPTRTGILDVVQKMGGNIEILDKKEVSGELVGDIKVSYSELKSCTIEGEIIPKLIDELPVIAVLATQAKGTTIIKDAQDLRNKESDRIKAVVNELKKIGAEIDETPDGFIINGKTDLSGGVEVESYHDHRLAMSLFVAGLICKKPIEINEFEWVKISFPEFENLFETIIK